MLKNFNTYLEGIDVNFWGSLCREYGELRSFKKGEDFIACGKVAKYFGFIKEGSLKYVVYTSDGKEKVIGLETVGGFGASFPFCLHDRPSMCWVTVNTDSQIYCLPVTKVKELIRSDKHVENLINESVTAVFYNIYSRYVDFYGLSPKERYEKLLDRSPQLFEIFNIKDIASYLNITDTHLRRLRGATTINRARRAQ